MKAIILAAWKGTRLEPITLKTPKAMVEVYGKPLLAHNMDKLLPYVNKFIIVVKYKQEIITSYFWEEYKGVKVSYHEQGEKKWTGWALLWLELYWELVIAYADALFQQKDIDAVMEEKNYAVLVKKVENPEKYGIFTINERWFAKEVIEKPKIYVWNLANFSFFKVNSSILDFVKQINVSPRWELELTDAINLFIQSNNLKPIILEHNFIDITSIDDLKAANTLTKPELWKTQYLENIWEYEIHLWIPQAGIQEIIDYTLDDNDVALRKWTWDWKKRFISRENFTSWYQDTDRYVFSLLDKNWSVVGIWWWRPAKFPTISKVLDDTINEKLKNNYSNIHTSGIRIYPPARGKWLASPFIEMCSRSYNLLFPNFCMSIDINAENIPSQKAFEKIWFQKLGYGQNKNNSKEAWKSVWNERFVYLQFYNS